MKRLQQRYRSDGEDLDFTYDFLDKIYEKTIMNKIISKLVDNTIPNTLIFNVEEDLSKITYTYGFSYINDGVISVELTNLGTTVSTLPFIT